MAEPQDILTAARCFDCIPEGVQRSVLLYVFDQIRVLQGGDAMTPQELLTAAKCFQSCIPKGLEGAALIYLASAIVDSGGGAGNQVSHGDGPPVAPPTDPTKAALYYDDLLQGTTYAWNVAGQVWYG